MRVTSQLTGCKVCMMLYIFPCFFLSIEEDKTRKGGLALYSRAFGGFPMYCWITSDKNNHPSKQKGDDLTVKLSRLARDFFDVSLT